MHDDLVTAPPCGGAEREVLLAFLQRQRDLVVWKLQALPDDHARAVSTPTGLTVHGLVLHLLDVERSWVRRWFAGQTGLPVLGVNANHVGGLSEAHHPPLSELVTAYVSESRRCDEVIEAHSLTDLEASGPITLRWVLHHLIEETARHLGHLDLMCELVDGRVGEEPPVL